MTASSSQSLSYSAPIRIVSSAVDAFEPGQACSIKPAIQAKQSDSIAIMVITLEVITSPLSHQCRLAGTQLRVG